MEKYKLKKGKTDYHAFTDIDMSIEARRKFDVGDVWMNQAKCKKCNDVIVSANRHDYATCKCGAISVDGGSWYCKRVAADLNDIEDMIVPFTHTEKNA